MGERTERLAMLARWLEALDCTVEAVDEETGVRARSEHGIPFWCTVFEVDTGGTADVKAFAWAALYRPTDEGRAEPGRLARLANAFMQQNLPSAYHFISWGRNCCETIGIIASKLEKW